MITNNLFTTEHRQVALDVYRGKDGKNSKDGKGAGVASAAFHVIVFCDGSASGPAITDRIAHKTVDSREWRDFQRNNIEYDLVR